MDAEATALREELRAATQRCADLTQQHRDELDQLQREVTAQHRTEVIKIECN